VAYKINTKTCLKCGICIDECPEKAIVVDKQVTEYDGLTLFTDCGVCVSFEWWCPAKAIVKA